jgi:hypothetical protein
MTITYFVSSEWYSLEFIVTLYQFQNVETHQNKLDFKMVFSTEKICPPPTQKCKLLIFSYLFEEDTLNVFQKYWSLLTPRHHDLKWDFKTWIGGGFKP